MAFPSLCWHEHYCGKAMTLAIRDNRVLDIKINLQSRTENISIFLINIPWMKKKKKKKLLWLYLPLSLHFLDILGENIYRHLFVSSTNVVLIHVEKYQDQGGYR